MTLTSPYDNGIFKRPIVHVLKFKKKIWNFKELEIKTEEIFPYVFWVYL